MRWRYPEPRSVSARPQALAKLVGTLRPGKQAFEQRAQIQASTADHDRQMTALRNLANRRPRLPGILAGGERLTRFGDIDQVMRNSAAIFARRLGSPDLEVAINRNRVATDNLAGELLRECNRECRLARSRRSENDDQQRIRRSGRCVAIHRAPQGMVLPKRTNAITRITNARTSNPDQLHALARLLALIPLGSFGLLLACCRQIQRSTAPFYAPGYCISPLAGL